MGCYTVNSEPTSIQPARIRERSADGLPAVIHPGWSERFPWLIQGTTAGARAPGGPFDLGLFAVERPGADVPARWERLRRWAGADTVTHARQVHGAEVRLHGSDVGSGLWITPDCDGHATAREGVLLAVSLADCAPVSLVDAGRRAVALVHAGWRGAAGGILERGIAVLESGAGSRPGDLYVHIGPAICGACYEVGGDVFEALGRPRPTGPAPIDLRGVLAERAATAGVHPDRITVSEHCTRCGPLDLFSHRRGDAGRHVAFLGIRR
jgi:polyphenol oxidase